MLIAAPSVLSSVRVKCALMRDCPAGSETIICPESSADSGCMLEPFS